MMPGHEYSDGLNPFLVKELRAGFRAKSYVTVFLCLLAALTVHALAMTDNPDAAFFAGPVFNVILHLTLVLFIPLGSLGAIAGERSGRKLEPLILSPLTARDLVYGKWLVVAIQSGVPASLTAPFIVIRHFNGGVNVVNDLAHIVIALCTGWVFSAVTLCASGLMREDTPFISIIIRVVAAPGLLYAGTIALTMMLFLGLAGLSEVWIAALIAPFGAAFCIAVILEIAALTLGINFGSSLPRRQPG
jgi:ABC-type transport system involved in multi-copper enzyme maturation permease subunit